VVVVAGAVFDVEVEGWAALVPKGGVAPVPGGLAPPMLKAGKGDALDVVAPPEAADVFAPAVLACCCGTPPAGAVLVEGAADVLDVVAPAPGIWKPPALEAEGNMVLLGAEVVAG
jgi:hypothetical protein